MASTLIAHDALSPSAAPGTNILSWTPTPLNGFASAWVNNLSAYAGTFTVTINLGAKFTTGTPRSTPLVKIKTGLFENYEISCDMYYGNSDPYRMGFWCGVSDTPSDPVSEGNQWLNMQADVSGDDVYINRVRYGAGGGNSIIGVRTAMVVGSGWGFRWGFTSTGPAAASEVQYWWEPYGGGTRTVLSTIRSTDGGFNDQDSSHTSIGLHYENANARHQNVMVYAIDPLGVGCDDPISPTIYTGDGDASILPIFSFDPAWLAK